MRRLLARAAKEATSLPRLVGDGEPEFSTSLGLDIIPRIVWDTNGFYRALGVPFDASKRELASAYLACHGHRSVRLTHIVKTLLQPTLRSRYDCTPLGMLWADDPDLAVAISEAIEDGSPVFSDEPEWAVYVFGIDSDEIDWALVSEWRSAIATAWCHDGMVSRMAVGLSLPDVEPHVRSVGNRSVAFLPIGVALKQTSEYARSLAARVERSANR